MTGARGGRVLSSEPVLTLVARVRALFPEASGRTVKQWIEQGRVAVNGAVVRQATAPVGARDRVALGARGGVAEFPAELRLVHEDDDILVIDKPAGLLTVATPRERERTAFHLLWGYLQAKRPPRRPFIVHRLDRETSGLLVFATSVGAKRRLQAQFEARQVDRVYVALVHGLVRLDEGVMESRLAEDRSLRVRPSARGRDAITRYRVLARRRDTTVLELSLGTGRRRQIRVQLAALGHPIVGDAEHGGRPGRAGRMYLHATRLGFAHPRDRSPVRFESAPPSGWV